MSLWSCETAQLVASPPGLTLWIRLAGDRSAGLLPVGVNLTREDAEALLDALTAWLTPRERERRKGGESQNPLPAQAAERTDAPGVAPAGE